MPRCCIACLCAISQTCLVEVDMRHWWRKQPFHANSNNSLSMLFKQPPHNTQPLYTSYQFVWVGDWKKCVHSRLEPVLILSSWYFFVWIIITLNFEVRNNSHMAICGLSLSITMRISCDYITLKHMLHFHDTSYRLSIWLCHNCCLLRRLATVTYTWILGK